MSKVKVAVNGFGRIGREVVRLGYNRPDIEIVAINSTTCAETYKHLLKYDSVYGIFNPSLEVKGKNLILGGKEIRCFGERDPSKLPWKDLDVDVVFECTGKFRKLEECRLHIDAGAKKVLLSAPPKSEGIKQFVMGVNEGDYVKDSDGIVSVASCTTNCLAPLAKVLNDEFGIRRGLLTTIHAYTGDQRLLDGTHKDLRRARSAAINLVPTTTGAAKAVGIVLPELKGKLTGMAVRVPVPDGSLVDLTTEMDKDITPEQVNAAMKKAAEGKMKGIIEYSEEPLVSVDIIGNKNSCIFDALSTQVMGGNMLKTLAWYDNERGYAMRMVEFLEHMFK